MKSVEIFQKTFFPDMFKKFRSFFHQETVKLKPKKTNESETVSKCR